MRGMDRSTLNGMSNKTFKTRFFNSITYSALSDTVTKTSRNEAALRNEINWYRCVPAEIKMYLPRVFQSFTGDTPFITMEYVRLPLLGELLVSAPYASCDWLRVLEALLEIVRTFSRYAAPVSDAKSICDMAIAKTTRRTRELLRLNRTVAGYYARGHFSLNGCIVRCPIRWFEANIPFIERLAERPLLHLIHGDMHFSNIFHDFRSGETKLIDPRGSFGLHGIYGDPCYDLGKVRHSLSGYEHIVRDRFLLDFDRRKIDLHIDWTIQHARMPGLWDELTATQGWKARLWEILSFLSLLPLHKDAPRKQLAFYAVAASLIEDFTHG